MPANVAHKPQHYDVVEAATHNRRAPIGQKSQCLIEAQLKNTVLVCQENRVF